MINARLLRVIGACTILEIIHAPRVTTIDRVCWYAHHLCRGSSKNGLVTTLKTGPLRRKARGAERGPISIESAKDGHSTAPATHRAGELRPRRATGGRAAVRAGDRPRELGLPLLRWHTAYDRQEPDRDAGLRASPTSGSGGPIGRMMLIEPARKRRCRHRCRSGRSTAAWRPKHCRDQRHHSLNRRPA